MTPIGVGCSAGQGVRGDRFFGHDDDFKGQITFFAIEVYERLVSELGDPGCDASVFRRNVVTRGVDLNELIGVVFEVQGVRFQGSEECSPCYWMDRAFGSGAKAAMRDNGGLRARVLSDGTLRRSGS